MRITTVRTAEPTTVTTSAQVFTADIVGIVESNDAVKIGVIYTLDVAPLPLYVVEVRDWDAPLDAEYEPVNLGVYTDPLDARAEIEQRAYAFL